MKILKVPHEYKHEDQKEDQIIFALAVIEEGNAKDVYDKLIELGKAQLTITYNEVEEILSSYYKEGLLKGKSINNVIYYNLNKIEKPNSGKVDPDLLDESLTDFED